MVQFSVQKIRVYVVGQQGERSDADAILEQHHAKSREHKYEFFPERPEGEVRHQQCQNQQGETRTDSAAFLRDFNGHLWQSKNKTFTEYGSAAEIEEQLGNCRGAGLQSVDDPTEENVGKGDREEQKCECEPRGFSGCCAQNQNKARDE